MIRTVGQEALGLLGSGRAILLQLAHPLVAAGVAQYSNFQDAPLSRLFGTLGLMNAIVFENRQRAQVAIEHFNAVHSRIQGRLPHAAGRFPAGTAYAASDPQLKLWVHATLVETGLKAYEKFVRPMSPDERRLYYNDTRLVGRLLGIPDDMIPSSLIKFHSYMEAQLTGDTLSVTATSRRLGWEVLHPSGVGWVQSLMAGLLRLMTPGLMSQRMRREYGLKWGRRHQAFFEAFCSWTRRIRPWSAEWIWKSPQLVNGLPRLLLWGTDFVGKH